MSPGNIVILGAAESGLGAAILANKMGWSVLVSDNAVISEENKNKLDDIGVNWEELGHSYCDFENTDLVVKSPGIPDNVSVVEYFTKRSIKVVSEIEFAGYYNKAKTICITGSNGKTTTAKWTYSILKNAGFKVGLAGNVGDSFAKQVAESDYEWYVLEISSFQLDGMFDFCADISILTNITPDHLDRYNNSIENYIKSKFKILQNQTKKHWFIYNEDDKRIRSHLQEMNLKMSVASFSLEKKVMGGYIDKKEIIININTQFNMSIHELALKGKHNTQNALAAGVAARVLEIRKEVVRESLQNFNNLEHRLEMVAKINGIEFINDSKATNINSTWYALESMDKPTVWIVGGEDKGNDYCDLKDLVKEKVKAIICLGVNNEKIIESFSEDYPEIIEVDSAHRAVMQAYKIASKNETVLLSPACASFDLFESYEDRGNQFKKAVRAL
ncbi:MAG: UDP-N-acetylmuramoyl-L-alanine--D-glutamate ligase [Crocinitomicaceae bacterium]|nr:UDP-N-acetylmuramoyl-L-alanine--D-glutamate ligase [Crocinitomicaceae bacterium]